MPLSTSAIKDDFNRHADHYDDYAIVQKQAASLLLEAVKAESLEGKSILDIGCGTGNIAKLVDQPILQTDLAFNMCKQANEHGLTSAMDMHALALKKDSIDTIISSLSLQWSDNLSRTFEECKSVLKKDGRLYFSTLIDGSLPELRDIIGSERLRPLYNETDYKMALNRNGFSLVNSTSHSLLTMHDTLLDLLKSIRNIGAGNKSDSRSTPLTKTQLEALEDAYKHRFITPDGSLPLTWKMITFEAKKA